LLNIDPWLLLFQTMKEHALLEGRQFIRFYNAIYYRR
jgi:hypothetical protein